MIYLKKPDGTIIQHDTDDEQQMLQALNIDKQLAAQKGEKFGDIYDTDSLPDEDKVRLGLMTQNELLIKIKSAKINEIISTFENELQTGHFMSMALDIEVDCRRSSSKNDKQNVEGLISNMSRNSKSTVDYVGYSEICPNVTQAQLTELVAEMEDHVLRLYEKKWVLQTQIENASTINKVKNINW
jgi:hypothetical protein